MRVARHRNGVLLGDGDERRQHAVDEPRLVTVTITFRASPPLPRLQAMAIGVSLCIWLVACSDDTADDTLAGLLGTNCSRKKSSSRCWIWSAATVGGSRSRTAT